MGINKFRDEIESLFEIFGLIEDEGFVPPLNPVRIIRHLL